MNYDPHKPAPFELTPPDDGGENDLENKDADAANVRPGSLLAPDADNEAHHPKTAEGDEPSRETAHGTAERFADELLDAGTLDAGTLGDGTLEDGTLGDGTLGDETFGDETAADTLSPAVRRLVKTYDLDITGIRGSGPSGRIRVGDVMQTLGARAAPGSADAEVRASAAQHTAFRAGTDARAGAGGDAEARADAKAEAAGPRPQTRFDVIVPATTVFECDIDGLLAHRRRERGRNVDVALASYFLAAAVHASRVVPEVSGQPGRMNVAVYGLREGQPVASIVHEAETMSFEALNAALTELARPLQSAKIDTEDTTFSVYEHGALGSVLAIPTPLGTGHAASLGIGRPRRQMMVRNVDGRDAARAVALCYVSLSYDPARIRLERANLYLSRITRAVERWQQP